MHGDEDGGRATLALLTDRVGKVRDVVEAALRLDLLPSFGAARLSAPWVLCGVGGSEGAARAMARLLASVGLHARFEPPSTFALEAVSGGTLVVFSQHLSPNARLALAARASFETTILVTAMSPEASAECVALAAAGVRFVQHLPPRESGILLRIMGPAAQLGVALRAAELLSARAGRPLALGASGGSIGPVLSAARERGRALPIPEGSFRGRVVMVASGGMNELAFGLRHKLLEGLGHCELWDLCGFVHGPLQGLYRDEATIVTLLDGVDARQCELAMRVRDVVDPRYHTVLPVTSSLPMPLGLLELDTMLDEVLLRTLAAKPRNLADWPGKGRDRAIYELDAALDVGR